MIKSMRSYPTLLKVSAVLGLLALPLIATAQAGGPGLNYTTNPLGSTGGGLFSQIFGCGPSGSGFGGGGVLCILRVALRFLLSISFIIALIFLVVGGFRYTTSQGNEDALEAAKGTMTSAIIGIVLIALAYFILNLVLQIANSGNP